MKKLLSVVLSVVLLLSCIPAQAFAADKILAFPGAEGAGMYTTGGRGGEIYIVDSLDGVNKTQGTIRDAFSKSDVIILFNVSGIIDLKGTNLNITGNNMSILGQSAPGDGICVTGGQTVIKGSNIIMRYLRFRPGTPENPDAEYDALTLMGKEYPESIHDIIIDHISTSWSTDEVFSTYGVKNLTVQWSILSESLTMSGHSKGRHGYGGLWGGNQASYHHNLFSSNTSRNPRINLGSRAIVTSSGNTAPPARMELVNNVIYNWGFNATYGGNDSKVNIINNYYKAGPGTNEEVALRIANPINTTAGSMAAEDYPYGAWYLNGNVVSDSNGNTNNESTNDNYSSKAFAPDNGANPVIMETPLQVEGEIGVDTAAEAFAKVIAQAGATYPKRDAVDARLVSEAQNGEGRFINGEAEVGGFPEYNTAALDSAIQAFISAPATAKVIETNGYSAIENYLNSTVNPNYQAQNPVVSITSLSKNQMLSSGESIKITADAMAGSANIAKVVFYANDNVIGTSLSAPYSATWATTEGNWYVSARAYDTNGLQTQSIVIPVHVNDKAIGGSWTTTDIGVTPIAASAAQDSTGNITVKGSGSLGHVNNPEKSNAEKTDAFGFTYQELEGDGEFVAKIVELGRVDHEAMAGLMIREDLTTSSRAAIISAAYVKADKLKAPMVVRFGTRTDTSKGMVFTPAPTATYTETKAVNNMFANNAIGEGYWLKITRVGDVVTSYVCMDGVSWEQLGTETFTNLKEKVYIGFAADAAQKSNALENYTYARFSNVELSTQLVVKNALVEAVTSPNYTVEGTLKSAGTATITLNSSIVSDKKAVAAGADFSENMTLVSGENTIVISAEINGKTFTKTLKVTLEQSAPDLNIITKAQTVQVSNALVEAKSSKAGTAIIKVNGVNAATGVVVADVSFSQSVSLEQGRNTVEITVSDVAGNKTTKKVDIVYLTKADYIIDGSYTGVDGSAVEGVPTYKTVTAALGAIPKTSATPRIIYVKNGIYKEKVVIETKNATWLGESVENTVLTYDDWAGKETVIATGTGTLGTSGSYSVYFKNVKDCVVENITFRNDFIETPGNSGEQAVAVLVQNSENGMAFKNCTFIADQDTLYIKGAGVQYYEDCYIEGDVDFIFGAASAVFNNCTIFSSYYRDRTDGRVEKSGGYIVAPNTSVGARGFLFLNASILSDAPAGTIYLGRPWGADGETMYVNSYLGEHIIESGWTTMSVNLPENARFREYNNYGPGANTTNATRWQLTEEQAKMFTQEYFLNNWNPNALLNAVYDSANIITISNPLSQTVTKASYTIAGTMVQAANVTITHNGKLVEGYNNVSVAAAAAINKEVKLENGANIIVITATNTAGTVTKTLNVVYDNIAPVFSFEQVPSAVVKETLFSTKAYINKYGLMTIKLNGETIINEKALEANEKVEVTFNFKEGINKIEVKVDDTNEGVDEKTFTVEYMIDWADKAFEVSGTEYKNYSGNSITSLQAKGDVFVSTEVINKTGLERKAVLVIGLFDGAGIMQNASYKNLSLQAGTNLKLGAAFKLPKDIMGYSVKVFVVDHLDNLDTKLSNIDFIQ